jgi:hypothetical protein
MKSSKAELLAADWDSTVRHAFLEGCVQQGIRAEVAKNAIERAHSPNAARELRAAADDAARRAEYAWRTIDMCLEQYGEMAALAFERCVEEASLQARRSSAPPSSLVVAGPPSAREDHALAIIDRAREKLAQFWKASGTSAA